MMGTQIKMLICNSSSLQMFCSVEAKRRNTDSAVTVNYISLIGENNSVFKSLQNVYDTSSFQSQNAVWLFKTGKDNKNIGNNLCWWWLFIRLRRFWLFFIKLKVRTHWLALFANFEAERSQDGPKKRKIFFSNVNQNKLYFPILVSDQQVVKTVSPYCAFLAFYGLFY